MVRRGSCNQINNKAALFFECTNLNYKLFHFVKIRKSELCTLAFQMEVSFEIVLQCI